MNKRMFAEKIKRITVGKGTDAHVDTSLIASRLTSDEAGDMVKWIVRCRGPVLQILVAHAHTDRHWLASMGYLHETTNRAGYRFIHTSEHHIKQ